MRRPLRSSLPLLVAALCFGLLTGAQAQTPQDSSVFGEQIDVRVVNVEAVVTDRSGNRVSGLKPGDFRLRVDGKEVPVEYFSEVKEGRALNPPAEAGKPGENQTGAKPEAAVQGLAEGAVGTYYLVFIDDYFAIPQQRDLVLKSMKADLSRLRPEDRMAIVAYDGGRLALLSGWSSSREDLARAFDQAMARPPHGLDRRVEAKRLATDEGFAGQTVGDSAPLDTVSRMQGLNERQISYGNTLYRQVQGDVQAAVSAMRGFAAPHGRKVMLLLSGGWPFSIQSYLSGGSGGGMPTRAIPEGDKLFSPLARTANLLGYTLYPVDLPGIQTAVVDAEAEVPGGFSSAAEQEIEGSLKFLAQETGGTPILNSNRTLALAKTESDTRSFYWLGFSPTWQRNDKPHDIRLEARRTGLQVRSRTGFLDLSRKAEVSMEVESALLFGNPPGGVRMPMKVGAPVKTKRGETEIPITLGLPVDLMTVVPVDGKFAAQLELRFAASDAVGNSSEIPVVPVSLKSERPPTPGKVVKYETKITLRGGANHIVVAAYDPLSGKIATAEADVKTP
jgi:VWFA-related protein